MKISEAVRSIIESHAFLRFGMSQRFFNLTRLATFLLPLVESRTKKDVSHASVLMALSRLGSDFESAESSMKGFQVDELTVHADLELISIERSPDARKAINKLYTVARKHDRYLTITEGMHEITLIYHSALGGDFEALLEGHIKDRRKRLAGLGIRFREEYIDSPGFLHLVLQQLAVQGVNVVEVASTSSEFIVYVSEPDMRLAFDSLYYTFRAKEQLQ